MEVLQEFQELYEYYRTLRANYEELIRNIMELEMLKRFIEELGKLDKYDGFVNLGGGIFIKAKILDANNLLVNVGNNIYIEKNKEEVIKILEEQINSLENQKRELEKELEEVGKRLAELQIKLEELREKEGKSQ